MYILYSYLIYNVHMHITCSLPVNDMSFSQHVFFIKYVSDVSNVYIDIYMQSKYFCIDTVFCMHSD